MVCQSTTIRRSRPAPPPPDHGPFVTQHIPMLGAERRKEKLCGVLEEREKGVESANVL